MPKLTEQQVREVSKIVQDTALETLQKITLACGVEPNSNESVDPERLYMAAVAAIMLEVQIDALIRASLPQDWQPGIRAFVDQMSHHVVKVLKAEQNDDGFKKSSEQLLEGGSSQGHGSHNAHCEGSGPGGSGQGEGSEASNGVP